MCRPAALTAFLLYVTIDAFLLCGGAAHSGRTRGASRRRHTARKPPSSATWTLDCSRKRLENFKILFEVIQRNSADIFDENVDGGALANFGLGRCHFPHVGRHHRAEKMLIEHVDTLGRLSSEDDFCQALKWRRRNTPSVFRSRKVDTPAARLNRQKFAYYNIRLSAQLLDDACRIYSEPGTGPASCSALASDPDSAAILEALRAVAEKFVELRGRLTDRFNEFERQVGPTAELRYLIERVWSAHSPAITSRRLSPALDSKMLHIVAVL